MDKKFDKPLIPTDDHGFYQCVPDAQLDVELIHATLNYIMEQNSIIMEALLSNCSRDRAKNAVKRWNGSLDDFASIIRLVEKRYLERSKK